MKAWRVWRLLYDFCWTVQQEGLTEEEARDAAAILNRKMNLRHNMGAYVAHPSGRTPSDVDIPEEVLEWQHCSDCPPKKVELARIRGESAARR